ncbi:arginyl-tRNA--protein transferase 1 isoform X3 [Culex pipiens pallens]|uniref:arginyl-tRNA--protein transferase 1 isoform X3 n=1 Tax=Culex pipiens pallens TaxID=42434 RepID=UPI0019534722|nr:arginyl-tRNA--protein transferase 1 isoform X3 [Culex pipiens pallens]
MFSIVDFYGKQANYSCGYCKQPKSCQSHGMWAHSLTVQDYQDLIDRGWRRSGSYCYKPEMDTTCCPSYTIKCDALGFRLNKSHKKIIKRVNKFLRDGLKGEGDVETGRLNEGEGGGSGGDLEMGEVARNPRKELAVGKLNLVGKVAEGEVATEGLGVKESVVKAVGSDSNLSAKSQPTSQGSPPKKAKLLRIERKRERLIQKGLSAEEIASSMKAAKGKNVEKSLEDFLDEAPKEGEEAAHRLKVKLVPSSEGASSVEYNLYRAYQTAVHQDPPDKLKMDRYKRFLVMSPLKLVTIATASDEFRRTLDRSFALYSKYQTAVHNDPPGAIGEYQDFLVKSPLKMLPGQSAPSCGLGSYHQQYWLDDRLIAVGVIDLLPSCVSSVYFFYDPEFRFLSLGTYGSLRELAFTRKLQQQLASISSYYMGFYIHSCPKMRYKSNLSPSFLLCPEVYSWHPLDQRVIGLLDRSKYCRLNEDPAAEDGNRTRPSDVRNVLILHGSSYQRYSSYLKEIGSPELEENVITYAKLVGKVCSGRMLLYEG